ncbi:hypothetical protein, partial [Embleya scabrispora]|uniref:hypothetical protein n=1 Tax=Embleya scabrispora TaxID=159449 RepID=UPI00117D9F9F
MTADVVAAAGTLVVLGEPGAGKTWFLRDLTRGLVPLDEPAAVPEGPGCVWVDGADLTEHSCLELLGRFLEALPRRGATGNEGQRPPDRDIARPAVTFVIDQLDESPMLERLPGFLRRALKARDTSGVRFLLACRSADFKQALADVLQDCFGACPLVDLAPLTYAEAVSLADSAGVAGVDVLNAAVDARAGALASVPLTLEFLVRTYREQGRLAGGPSQLFASGTRFLAYEHASDRSEPRPFTTTVEQRLVVAGRVAAWMLLSGRRTLWLGGALATASHPLDFDIASAVGGTETTGPTLTFEVTALVVEEALRTALFTPSGADRVSFRHSSVAAYLAARYLLDRGTRPEQLADLLLVRTPDEGVHCIPTPLRETAAWLVALDPQGTDWLSDADSVSLIAHSALVRSDAVRKLIVERLLEHADEVELADTRWYFSRWDLHHPGLDTQLITALTSTPGDPRDDRDTAAARVRIALRLARDCPSAALTPSLLRIVRDPRRPNGQRRIAAYAAFAGDEPLAAPVLREALHDLPDETDTGLATADPDRSLRATFLSLLWPRHLSVEELLTHLRPPGPKSWDGGYTHFLTDIPDACTDEQIPVLLAWMNAVWHSDPHDEEETITAPEPTGRGDGTACRPHLEPASTPNPQRFEFHSHSDEGLLLDAAIARAADHHDPTRHLPAMATLIARRFSQGGELLLPSALDPQGLQGPQLAAVTSLRRDLARALVLECVHRHREPAYATRHIVHGWHQPIPLSLRALETPEHARRPRLLTGSDFAWVLDQAADALHTGDSATANAFGHLASHLFDPDDPALYELAYDRRDNPSWPHLRWAYDPIVIHGDLAARLRRSHGAGRRRWAESDGFVAGQRQALSDLVSGDTTVFPDLFWNLQLDPATGRGHTPRDADPQTWPGMSVFDADERAQLLDGAFRYLHHEHDHADTWLAEGGDDLRAWAGHHALAWLDRRNRLDELAPGVWASWTGAVLGEGSTTWDEASATTEATLRRLAALHAPHEFGRDLDRLVRADLARGRETRGLDSVTLPPTAVTLLENLAHDLQDALAPIPTRPDDSGEHTSRSPTPPALADTDESHAAALRTWSHLLAILIDHGSPTPRDLAATVVDHHATSAGVQRTLAVRAALVLLTTDAIDFWP